MPILIACLARQVPTPRDQPRPRNPMSPERYVAIVRSIAVIFRANQPPTRARLAHRPDARAPCPCRLVKQFAGLARSRAPGRPRAADTPRRGLVIYDSHEYYPTHSGRSLSGHLFSIGRGARDARGSRAAAESRAPVARSRARPSRRHLAADRSHPGLSHDRAANSSSSDGAEAFGGLASNRESKRGVASARLGVATRSGVVFFVSANTRATRRFFFGSGSRHERDGHERRGRGRRCSAACSSLFL